MKRTTRDEPDYDKLMNYRLDILREHGLGLKDVQATIGKIDPLPGAKEFLDELRSITQVIILSDTFLQFAQPLMKKLGYPTLFCNELVIGENGMIDDFRMRCEKSKLTTVRGLQSIGFETIAAGDSFNDLGMIQPARQDSCSRVRNPFRRSIQTFRRTKSLTNCWMPSRRHCRLFFYTRE